MSALPITMPEAAPGTSPARRRLSPELERTIHEVAESERALDDLLAYSSRLHQSHIAHDPRSCLVCFGA